MEIIERKGLGHPDTFADRLAEKLSIAYSLYTINNYGVVLHHNFDKVGVMGGVSKVSFGGGEILSPIRILLNGRASFSFGREKIPVYDILYETTYQYIKTEFPMLNLKKDVRIINEVSQGSSPGAVSANPGYRHSWFSPEDISDLSELKHLVCNDTSLGTAFYHKSPSEKFVYDVETLLNSNEYKKINPWVGNDIKIMCHADERTIFLTAAVPQIDSYVGDIDEYQQNIETIRKTIYSIFEKEDDPREFELYINTRDKFTHDDTDIYLTHTGSSLEMGDEGFVGRGNRMGGLITPFRPYSMEGICGKNPVYHTGKVYSVAAYEISKQIYKALNLDVNVLIIGQSGHSLSDPWKIVFSGNDKVQIKEKENEIKQICYDVLKHPDKLTQGILKEAYPLV